ncbi:hypothetical protein [Desulfamplus magnetovallimortis]|nr:hypothetical protein [Desulfamplus magnetovallimortis]
MIKLQGAYHMATQQLYSHFHNLHFIKSQTFREPSYMAGEVQP